MATREGIKDLIRIMAQLRDPEEGCAWDRAQTWQSIAPYTLEEAYEVVDAIREDNAKALADELGDLLLQIVFLSQIATEKQAFTFDDVVGAICHKLKHRHPHIFGDEKEVDWDTIKAEERAKNNQTGALDGVALALPALTRAAKLCRRAARVGFDWANASQVLEKVEEEVEEVRAEMPGRDLDRLEDEIGDVLFTTASLARKLDLDPEACLTRSNRKFVQRFEAMERKLDEAGTTMSERPLEELEALWQSVKRDMALPRP